MPDITNCLFSLGNYSMIVIKTLKQYRDFIYLANCNWYTKTYRLLVISCSCVFCLCQASFSYLKQMKQAANRYKVQPAKKGKWKRDSKVYGKLHVTCKHSMYILFWW